MGMKMLYVQFRVSEKVAGRKIHILLLVLGLINYAFNMDIRYQMFCVIFCACSVD